MSQIRKALAVVLASTLVLAVAPATGWQSAEAQFRRQPPPGGGGRRPPPPQQRRSNGGGAAAGAAFGILAGALIGSAIQAQQQEEARRRAMYDDAIADCAARFRSYDPETQTYLGRDGRVRRCP